MSDKLEEHIASLAKAAKENRELFVGTVKALAAAIDGKDKYTRGHSERVARISVAIGKQMASAGGRTRDPRISALLHDVGKIAIDDNILKKPAALTNEEFEIMKTHPQRGYKIMSQIPAMEAFLPGMYMHHEMVNGKGYPQGLTDEQIPLQAKIVSVADTFDAMTIDRPYQKGMIMSEALTRIEALVGTRYDPDVVKALIRGCDSGEIGRGIVQAMAAGPTDHGIRKRIEGRIDRRWAMTQENQQETWQVDVGGQIYEAPFAELGDWIVEGSLQPTDKVRRGNLRWIEAKLVPSLVPFFNAKQQGLPMPVTVTLSSGETSDKPVEVHLGSDTVVAVKEDVPVTVAEIVNVTVVESLPQAPIDPFDPNVCRIHQDRETFYKCSDCEEVFCKECPKGFGGSVKICPLCGSMCKTLNEIAEAESRDQAVQQAVGTGFGISDLFAAFSYPFRYKFSLVAGGIMFAFFTLGRSAGAMGGIFMFVAAIFCRDACEHADVRSFGEHR